MLTTREEKRNDSISNALNKMCLHKEDWFSEVDRLISLDLSHCTNESQKAGVVLQWIKSCEHMWCSSVKDEILKRYNK